MCPHVSDFYLGSTNYNKEVKLFSCASPLRRTAARRREEIRECFTKVKQVFLLYLWGSLVTLELISLMWLYTLGGPPFKDPLAVKNLHN